MGRYVSFLNEEAFSTFASGEFTKSLKRYLSLARLCFLGPISEKITKFIDASPDFIAKEIQSISNLIETLNSLDLNIEGWIEELNSVKFDMEIEFERLTCLIHDGSAVGCSALVLTRSA
jgi:hypothetical protein